MLIAITQRKGEIHGGCDILESTYAHYFSKVGVTLIAIPNDASLVEGYFKQISFDGIILSGGGDVHPYLYNSNLDNLDSYSLKRDETEKKLIDIALEKNIPVLGICRGMQRMNVYFGGTLIQNIKKQVVNAIDHKETRHTIKLSNTVLIRELQTDICEVNSHHNLGIDANHLSKQLQPFAMAEDNTIEGYFHPHYAVAGIMWHPEREEKPQALNSVLVSAFLSRNIFWKHSSKKI